MVLGAFSWILLVGLVLLLRLPDPCMSCVRPWVGLSSYITHQGDPFNDLVDRVAKAAALHGSSSFTQWRPCADLLASCLCKWLWLLPASWCSHGLPSVWDLAAGTARDFVDLPTASVPGGAPSSDHKSKSLINLKCGSLGICTLRPQEFTDAGGLFVPALQLVLQSQCVDSGYHVLGIQETRLPKASTYASEHFLVFKSAAAAGQSGCSLWISRCIPLAVRGGRSLSLSLSQCQVLVSEPRLLLLKVRAPAVSWLFGVAHAPTPRGPWKRGKPGGAVQCSLSVLTVMPV